MCLSATPAEGTRVGADTITSYGPAYPYIGADTITYYGPAYPYKGGSGPAYPTQLLST